MGRAELFWPGPAHGSFSKNNSAHGLGWAGPGRAGPVLAQPIRTSDTLTFAQVRQFSEYCVGVLVFLLLMPTSMRHTHTQLKR